MGETVQNFLQTKHKFVQIKLLSVFTFDQISALHLNGTVIPHPDIYLFLYYLIVDGQILIWWLLQKVLCASMYLFLLCLWVKVYMM